MTAQIAQLEFPALSGVCLPEDSKLLRDYPLPKPKRSKSYEESFDRRTLIYDALRLDKKHVRLICPRLLNLTDPLLKGLKVGGRGSKPKNHRKSLRYEIIDLKCPEGKELRLDIAGQKLPIAIHTPSPLFEGQNTAFTMVKDTPPEWIESWARYHVSAHGLEGLLLYDNGTSAYDMAALGARLRDKTGLKSLAIVSAPFPYGGKAGGRFVVPAKFLQVSLMQIAKWRFLAQAHAVLSADIDELVAPIAGSNVFDTAAQTRLGLARLTGAWVYPLTAGSGVPQQDHQLSVPTAKACQPKWCLKRGGIADQFEWSVHRPGGPLFPFAAQLGHFWHCRATTTGWKAKRTAIPEGAQPNEALQNALKIHLPVV